MSAEEIFESVVESRVDICRRCFRTTGSTEQLDSLTGGPSCGDDCSTLSASLEDVPIRRSKIETRAPRLLTHIQRGGYSIDEELFYETIDLLAEIDEPPYAIFIDAIRAAIGDIPISGLVEEHDLESPESIRTRGLLRRLPSTDISEQDLDEIDESVASEVRPISDSYPGTYVFYVPNPDNLPQQYQVSRAQYSSPFEAIRLVIQENENWFWSTSTENLEDWLDALSDDVRSNVHNALYEHIQSRQRFTTSDSESPREQFRRTSLWPVLSEHGQEIMGFLRRSGEPKSLSEISNSVDLSTSTTRIILTVLHDTTLVSRDTASEYWQAI